MRKVSVIIIMLCLVAAAVSLLPLFAPAQIPYHAQISSVVELINEHYLPKFFGGVYAAYAPAAILLCWAIFFLSTSRSAWFWWMVPYSALIMYTLFLFTQLQSGTFEPQMFLSRLEREPFMGSVLIILAQFLELTIYQLLIMLSSRQNRYLK